MLSELAPPGTGGCPGVSIVTAISREAVPTCMASSTKVVVLLMPGPIDSGNITTVGVIFFKNGSHSPSNWQCRLSKGISPVLVTVTVTVSNPPTCSSGAEGTMLTSASGGLGGGGVAVSVGVGLAVGVAVGASVAGGSIGDASTVSDATGTGAAVGSSAPPRSFGPSNMAVTTSAATQTNAAIPPAHHIQRGKRRSGAAGTAGGGDAGG